MIINKKPYTKDDVRLEMPIKNAIRDLRKSKDRHFYY